MGETSSIEWTDATVNFWWGCTKVGPGCDHCYAEAFDKRVGGAHWGTGLPRRQIERAPNTLAKLNRQRGKRVFIQSMSDLFDNEVPTAWFNEAWYWLSRATDCRIQILTKRISMVEKRLAEVRETWPAHAGLMITVVNQAEADRDIPRLLALKAKLGIPWVGVSMEPLLGPVDLTSIRFRDDQGRDEDWNALSDYHFDGHGPGPVLDWVIVGGESGPKARPMHPDWARSLRDQCHAAGVPFFFKQWGEWAPCELAPAGRFSVKSIDYAGQVLAGNAAAFGGDAPVELMSRIGKARAGRLLDGREWNEVPGALAHG